MIKTLVKVLCEDESYRKYLLKVVAYGLASKLGEKTIEYGFDILKTKFGPKPEAPKC